jgi:hypothetical protein
MIRDIQNIDDDIVRKKRIIAQMLYEDPDIIEVLDNPELDHECPEEYLYNNIYPFIRIPGTQDTSRNYITFMLDDIEKAQFNKTMKSQFLKVVIFVHKDHIETKWGADRHDLLAYLVRDIFHLSNSLGMQLTLLSNREGVTDTDYCTRTLQFEMITPNSIKPLNTNQYEYKSIMNRKDRVIDRESVGGDNNGE